MVRLADYVIQRIVDEGVKHIFLITNRRMLVVSFHGKDGEKKAIDL